MSRTSSNSSRSSDKTTYSNTSSSEEEYSDDDNNYETGSESASGGGGSSSSSTGNSRINKSDAGGAELETQPRETRPSSETLHPCYEDYMPDQEPPLATSRATNSETGSQASVKSEAPALTHESLTEILAEAFFRAGQKSEKTFPPQSEPEPEIAATLLSQVGVKPAAKRKVNPPTKKAAGIGGVASTGSRQTTSQTKKKLANFQKLQKQLASQIDELLEQLE